MEAACLKKFITRPGMVRLLRQLSRGVTPQDYSKNGQLKTPSLIPFKSLELIDRTHSWSLCSVF